MPYPPSYPAIGMPLTELQTVDSTNNYALTQIYAGLAQHGWAVFAHEQVAGKGQRGKIWASSKGANIALSIVINPAPLQLAQQFHLSACMAAAVHEFISRYAGSGTSIKWPNDLYWKDRKAGGILIENVVRSSESGAVPAGRQVLSRETGPDSYRDRELVSANWQWAVVGIGININQTQFPNELPNPVSLKQITGNDFDPVELTKELCLVINQYYNKLITKGFEDILSVYLSHFYKLGEKVKLKKDSRLFEAVVKGIAHDGKLIVQHHMEEQFAVGEIQWMI